MNVPEARHDSSPRERQHWLPFAAFNLRCNPFGEKTQDDRAALAVVDAQRWVSVATQPQRAIQFIGECGRGKTTHLLALRRILPEAAYVYLPEDGPLPEIPRGRPLMIDEAQRLPCRTRRQVWRRGGALVLGTHVDLSKTLQRYGYRVETIQVERQADPEQLAKIFNRRLEAARLDPTRPVARISREETAILLTRFETDIRAMESYLYERIQQLAGADCGEVRFID